MIPITALLGLLRLRDNETYIRCQSDFGFIYQTASLTEVAVNTLLSWTDRTDDITRGFFQHCCQLLLCVIELAGSIK